MAVEVVELNNWKDITNFEDFYQISADGMVKSLYRLVESNGHLCPVKERILKKYKGKGGYYCVHLHKDGKLYNLYIHRLVAEAFIPNPDNLPEVNHRNELKTDNRVENLEWCDRKYNSNYGTRTKRLTEKQQKPVYQYMGDELIKEWSSAKEAADYFGINRGCICDVCRGRYKKCCGYNWSYIKK